MLLIWAVKLLIRNFDLHIHTDYGQKGKHFNLRSYLSNLCIRRVHWKRIYWHGLLMCIDILCLLRSFEHMPYLWSWNLKRQSRSLIVWLRVWLFTKFGSLNYAEKRRISVPFQLWILSDLNSRYLTPGFVYIVIVIDEVISLLYISTNVKFIFGSQHGELRDFGKSIQIKCSKFLLNIKYFRKACTI